MISLTAKVLRLNHALIQPVAHALHTFLSIGGHMFHIFICIRFEKFRSEPWHHAKGVQLSHI